MSTATNTDTRSVKAKVKKGIPAHTPIKEPVFDLKHATKQEIAARSEIIDAAVVTAVQDPAFIDVSHAIGTATRWLKENRPGLRVMRSDVLKAFAVREETIVAAIAAVVEKPGRHAISPTIGEATRILKDRRPGLHVVRTEVRKALRGPATRGVVEVQGEFVRRDVYCASRAARLAALIAA